MIIDTIDKLPYYSSLHPAINSLNEFLRENNLRAINEVVDETEFKLIPLRVGGNRDIVSDKLELHKQYFDIHITLSGTDTIAFAPQAEELSKVVNYDSENDYEMGLYRNVQELQVPVGYFCLIPVHMAHMALYNADEACDKIVVKLKA